MNELKIITKYAIGDKVYTVAQSHYVKITCEICEGLGKINYNNKQMRCPECQGAGFKTEKKHTWNVCDEAFEITSIKLSINSYSDVTITYKVKNQSSSITKRSELTLFKSKEDAQQLCNDNNTLRQLVKIEDIIISDSFSKTIPNGNKIAQRIKEYKTDGRYKNEIVVNKDMVLLDGYTTYLVCKMLGAGIMKVAFK